jgi:hypothetical protein
MGSVSMKMEHSIVIVPQNTREQIVKTEVISTFFTDLLHIYTYIYVYLIKPHCQFSLREKIGALGEYLLYDFRQSIDRLFWRVSVVRLEPIIKEEKGDWSDGSPVSRILNSVLPQPSQLRNVGITEVGWSSPSSNLRLNMHLMIEHRFYQFLSFLIFVLKANKSIIFRKLF